jgi:1-acyl-sn-glycerol-3-phosphate acyltransferase
VAESDSEKKNKRERKSRQREIMPVRPIKKGKKLFWFRQGFYSFARPIVRGICKLIFDLSFEGTENVPTDGSNIFASNHRSYGDPIFVALMTRVPISYMAKEELFKQNIFFTLLIKAWGAFPVTRGTGDTAVIDTSIEKLESGRNLLLFPEGTRSKDGKVGKGKTGVALIAAVAQTQVIPVGINFEGEKLKFRKKVVVRYGKPIDPKEIGVSDASPANLKKMKKEIMDSITKLVY